MPKPLNGTRMTAKDGVCCAPTTALPDKAVRIAYFIASHVNPAQVARLVRACRSSSPGSRVLIHHDHNVSNLDPKTLGPPDNIDFLTGQPPVQWDMFSMGAMVLRHMRWLLIIGNLCLGSWGRCATCTNTKPCQFSRQRAHQRDGLTQPRRAN
jgi:hypothetical protein